MTAPATQAPPARPAPTHPCARCGAPVAPDVGLCERCNPLGLKDSASSQVHGTVFLAVSIAVVTLAVVAHVAVSGIGPFKAQVGDARAAPGAATAVLVTISVRNEGTSAGTATCRLTDPSDPGITRSDVVYSPVVQPGATIAFDHEVPFGTAGQPLTISCSGPR